MALKILAVLTVPFTHMAVKLYEFVRQPFSPKRFARRAIEAVTGVVIGFLAMTGFMAVYGAGGIPMVWAQVLVDGCKSTGWTLAECSSNGSWWTGVLLGMGLMFVMAGAVAEASVFGRGD